MRSSSVSSPSRPSGSCQSNSLESFAGPFGRLLSLSALVWAAVDMMAAPSRSADRTVWLQYSPFGRVAELSFALPAGGGYWTRGLIRGLDVRGTNIDGSGARRHQGAGPLADPRRPLVHDDACGSRRRGLEDREPRRRRRYPDLDAALGRG